MSSVKSVAKTESSSSVSSVSSVGKEMKSGLMVQIDEENFLVSFLVEGKECTRRVQRKFTSYGECYWLLETSSGVWLDSRWKNCKNNRWFQEIPSLLCAMHRRNCVHIPVTMEVRESEPRYTQSQRLLEEVLILRSTVKALNYQVEALLDSLF